MKNIIGVTSFMRKKIIEQGGDPERETLNLVPTKDGKLYFVDSINSYWSISVHRGYCMLRSGRKPE